MLAVGSSGAVPQTPPRASPKAVVPPQAPMRRVGFAEPRSREPSPELLRVLCAAVQGSLLYHTTGHAGEFERGRHGGSDSGRVSEDPRGRQNRAAAAWGAGSRERRLVASSRVGGGGLEGGRSERRNLIPS